MNLDAATSYAIKQLEPIEKTKYYYHNVYHALDVFKSVSAYILIGNINATDALLLKTAAIFHDIGILRSYENHEAESVKIISTVLPDFGYSNKDIEVVSRLIMATTIPTSPMDDLEMYICDADFDYMGRDDYFEISGQLRHEWEALGLKKYTDWEWLEYQLNFLMMHNYYSQAANASRNEGKSLNIEKIQKLLKIV